VTIGVPVYNGERFLAQCIDSLLAQTYRDFTLLLSDNASTDRTAEICQRYAATDSRVHYHRNEINIGLYGNFRFILQSVRTRYVKLASADDFWSPAMLADAVTAMEHDPSLVLCYPKAVLVDENGGKIRNYENPLRLMEDDPTVRFRSVLEEIGLVNQLMGVLRVDVVRSALPLIDHTLADRVFLAELSLYGKIAEFPEYQYYRRFHEGASSWNRDSTDHQVVKVFKPGTRGIWLSTWKYYGALFRRLLHCRLGYGAKLKLLLFLGRRATWDRYVLLRECWQFLLHYRTS
jgi:glycosyltransferase involved in cell wall biosynthesis